MWHIWVKNPRCELFMSEVEEKKRTRQRGRNNRARPTFLHRQHSLGVLYSPFESLVADFRGFSGLELCQPSLTKPFPGKSSSDLVNAISRGSVSGAFGSPEAAGRATRVTRDPLNRGRHTCDTRATHLRHTLRTDSDKIASNSVGCPEFVSRNGNLGV